MWVRTRCVVPPNLLTCRLKSVSAEARGWHRTPKWLMGDNKFTSGGNDDVMHVWSKDSELLIEMKGHDNSVESLCWSKDGAFIFSAKRLRLWVGCPRWRWRWGRSPSFWTLTCSRASTQSQIVLCNIPHSRASWSVIHVEGDVRQWVIHLVLYSNSA